MSERSQFVLLARYNAWMNVQLYGAAARLTAEELQAERGAFFGSLIGTLNHIVAGDTIWLRRFAAHPARHAALAPLMALPAPATLDAIHSRDLAVLFAHRQWLDELIERWSGALDEGELAHVLQYRNSRGVEFRRRFGSLVLHFFNHQTHHRGQATTLLHQAGIDVGVTDLLTLVADEGPDGLACRLP